MIIRQIHIKCFHYREWPITVYCHRCWVWRFNHSNSCSGNPDQKVCAMPFKTYIFSYIYSLFDFHEIVKHQCFGVFFQKQTFVIIIYPVYIIENWNISQYSLDCYENSIVILKKVMNDYECIKRWGLIMPLV